MINAPFIAHDTAWIRAAGDIATTAVGPTAVVQVWRTLAFDFLRTPRSMALFVRWVLLIGVIGSVIGLILNVIRLLTVCYAITR